MTSFRPLPASLALLSLLALGVAPPAAAQGPSPTGFDAVPWNPLWPQLPPKTFTRTVAGEFTGDLDGDAFVIADGTPRLMVTPEAYRTSISVAYPALDMATLGALAGEDRDSLVAVGPDGLVRYAWDDALDDFAVDVLSNATAWTKMVHVRVGDLDGLLGEDVVGLSSDPSTEVRVLYGDGTGGFAGETVFQTAFPARRFELVDWQGDGTLEICLVTDAGLEIYDRAGNPVANELWSWSDIVIAVIDQDELPYQRVAAIVTDVTGADDYLIVKDQIGTSAPTFLGQLGIVELVPGDFDADGDTDLVASLTQEPEALFLFNQADESLPSTFAMGGAGSLELPLGDPSGDFSQSQARPAVRDWDHDGDLDVLFPVHDEGRVELLPNTLVDEEARKVVVQRGDYFWDEPGGTGWLQLTLTQPGVLPAGVTDVELVVWRQPSFGAGTQPVAFEEQYFGVDGTWPKAAYFETGEPDLLFTRIYSVEARFVERDAGGAVIAKHAAYTTSYSQHQPTWQALGALPGAGTILGVPITAITFQPAGDGPVEVLPGEILLGNEPDEVEGGGLTDLPEIPDFPEDEDPERNEG